MAHQILHRATSAGMRQFRIVYYDPPTGKVLNIVDIWAETLNEAYRETLKVSEAIGVVSELDGRWGKRIKFNNPVVAQ